MMGLVPPGFVDDAGGIVQQQQQRLPAAVGGFPRVDLVGSRHNSSCRDEREQLEVVVARSSDYSSSLYEESNRRSFRGWPGNGLEDKGLPLSREVAAAPPPPPPPAQMLYHLLPPGFETKEAIEHSRRQTRVVEPPGGGFAAGARSPSPPRLLYRSEATFLKRGREEYTDVDRERYQRNQRFIDSFSASSMQPPLRKRLRDGQGPGNSSMESDAPPPPRGLSEMWKGTTRRGDDEFKDGQRRRPPSWSPPPRRRPPSWSPPPRRRLDGNMVFLQESRVKHTSSHFDRNRFRSPESLRPERGVASPRLRDRLKFPEDVPEDVSLHPKFNGPPPRPSSQENDTDHHVKRHDFLPKRKASYSPPPRGNDTRNSTGESHKGRRELQDMDNEDSPPRFTQRHKDSDTPTRIQQWVHPNRDQPLSSDISVLKESSLDTPLSRKSRLGQGTIRQGSASGKSLLEGRLKYEGHPDGISGGTDLRKEEHHRDSKQHTRSFEGNHKEKSKVLKPEGKSSLSSKISITSPDLKAEGNTSWKSVSPIRQKISSGSEQSKRLGNGKMLSSHTTSPQVCQEISSVLPSSQNSEAEKQETLNQAVKDRVPVASILSEQQQDFWHDTNSDLKNMGVQEKSIKQGIKELSATPQHNSSPYPVPMVGKLSFNSDEKDSLSAREQGLATTKASSGKLMPGHSIVPKQQVVLVNCAEQMPRSKSLQPEKSRSTPSRRPSHSVEDGISLKKAESMEMDTGQPIKIGGEMPHESQRLSQEWGEKQAMNENLNCGRPVQKVIYTGHKAENVKEFTSGKTILGSTLVEVSDKLLTIVQEQIPSSLNSKQRSWSPSCVAATTENHGDQQGSLCTGKDRKCDSSSGLRSLLLFPEPSLQDKEKKKSQWLQTEEREVNIEILDLNIEEGNVSMSQEALLSKLGTVKSSSEVGDLLLPDHLQENHPVSPIKIEISQPPTEKLVEQQFSNEKPERATPSAGRPVVSSVGAMTREVRLFGTNLIAAIPDAIEVEKRQRKRPLEVCEPCTQAQLPDFSLPPVVDGNQSNTSPGKETIGAQEVIDASPQGSTEVVPTFDVHDRKEAIMVQSKEMVSPMLAKGEAQDVKQVQINDCKPSEKETFISSREEIMVSDATTRCLTDGDVVSAPDHHEIVQTEVHVQTDHGIEGTFQTGLSPSFKQVHAHSPPGKSLQRAVGAAQLPQPRLGTGGSSASHPSGGNIWRRDSGAASNPSSLANTNQAAQRSTRGSVSVHRVAVGSTTTVNHQATIKQSGQRQSPKSANVPRPPTSSMSTNTAIIKSSSLPTAPRSVVAPGSAAYVRKRKNTLVRFPAPPITGLPSTSVHVNVPSGPSRSTPMDIKDSAFTAFDPLSRSHVSQSSQLSDSTVTNSTGKMMTFHDTSRTGEHDIARSTHPVSSSSQNTQVWPALVDQSRSLPPISQSAVSGSEHLAAEILQDIARHTHTTKDTATVASNLLDTSTIRPSSSAAGNVPSGSRLYMRRKANQLVAAPLVQSSVVVTPPVPHSGDFTLGWPPVDVYVKRKTNQLVRNNIGKDTSDKTGLQDGSVGRFADGLAEGSRQRRWQFQIQKTKLGRVLSQKKRPARGSSWVWTLGGESKVPAAVMGARGSSVSPALFPWKRTGTLTPRLRRRRSLPEAKKGSLLFHLGKKLQGFRSAQPVYTRSADGFSLRRSGVVSQHGANLKWTKSLENRSKLASEAATKAVAEAEKKKRQRKEAVVVATTAAVKAKADKRAARKGVRAAKLLPRERIVWVGLVAYKMDSSRHTLQRLPDLQGPAGNGGTSALPGGLDTSALLTPKRSQIGGAVYVRVGSGNQLVRDPKTATRAFASEKVRWSLHNARFRRAKKQTFCQFYTRFGKCNKGDGKCPFIHDPDKVAVCTKFLKGSCDDSTCLLTHKVIPERMPDCSYFLEGLCTNESCPYRHVNVNPKAAVCEGFLRGYCADGDLCNKKHTYVCPVYAETGKCPLIGTCKLHHPKKKEQHIAPTKDQKITGKRKRRYFVTENPIGDQIQRDSSSKELVEPSDEIGEFISLNDVGAETFSNTVQEPERFGWRKKRLQLTSLLKHGEAVAGLETQLKPSFLLQKDKES